MSLPKKITPCPIIDAIIEIRFSAKIHPSAIFGVIYNSIADRYPKVQKLPILQVPEPLREADSVFKYKPYFKVSNSTYIVQIGPDVFTISSFPEYVGWEEFSKEIFWLIEKIDELSVIANVQRLGIRYINFFALNIFEQINLEILLKNSQLIHPTTHLRTQVTNQNYESILQLTNDFRHNSENGSIIDIDTFTDSKFDGFFVSFKNLINQGHSIEKELFFSLLKPSFLNSLQTGY